jgi:hypothetical protein
MRSEPQMVHVRCARSNSAKQSRQSETTEVGDGLIAMAKEYEVGVSRTNLRYLC